ncbi:hypothetical protein [Metallibacterium sp.]
MRKSRFWLLAAGACIPAIALAAQPLLVHFDGRNLPMHETTQVERTAAGPVQVRTWTWRSPQGNDTIMVQRSNGATALPAWALQQMRAMQAQMQQMQNLETSMDMQWMTPLQTQTLSATLEQPLWSAPALPAHLPIAVTFAQPQESLPALGPMLPVAVVVMPAQRAAGYCAIRQAARPAPAPAAPAPGIKV